jgi:hypothetical protein
MIFMHFSKKIQARREIDKTSPKISEGDLPASLQHFDIYKDPKTKYQLHGHIS